MTTIPSPTRTPLTACCPARRLLALAAVLLLTLAGRAQQQEEVTPLRTDSQHIVVPGHTPPFALRNNLLYDAALTPNLGFDYRLNRRWSAGATVGYRPWPTSDTRTTKWRHLLIMPELRHWSDSTFADRSWFWGINAVWSHYNVANLGFPVATLYPSVRHERRQGDLLAVGASLGRSWRLSRWLRLEAEAGLDVGYAWGDRYECGHCGTRIGDFSGPFLVPKLALNLVLHKQPSLPQYARVPVDTVRPLPPLQLALSPVADFTGRAGCLQQDNPVLEHISHYRPYDRTRILRKERGALYVHFPLDKSLLSHDFRDNGPVLDRIVDITRQIMADSTSDVRRIQIVGLASIEGTIAHNEQLAADRAQALKDYIQQRVGSTPDSLFELCNGGEAWAELRDQINDALMARRQADADAVAPAQGTPTGAQLQAALDIIDTEPDMNRREQRLRQLDRGRTYQYLRTQLLPDQRNSGYLRIYYDYVPDTRAALINQAAQLMQQGRNDEALSILYNVRDDQRSWNALACALWHAGRTDEARSYFRRAADSGNADARLNLKMISER